MLKILNIKHIDTKILLIFLSMTILVSAQSRQEDGNKVEQELKQTFILAKGLEDAGRIDRALRVYKKLYEKRPGNSKILNRYTSLLIMNGEYDKVKKILKNHWNDNPGDFSAQIKLGEVYYKQGKKKKAFQKWDNIYQNNLRNREAHKTLFKKLMELKEYDKCIEIIKYLRDKRNKPEYLANELGDLYKKKEEYTKAVKEYFGYALNRDKLKIAEEKILSLPDSIEVFNQIEPYLEDKVNQKGNINSLQLYQKVLFKYGKFEKAQEVVFQIEENANYPGKFILRFGKNLVKEDLDSLARTLYNQIIDNEKLEQIHRTAMMQLADLYKNIFKGKQINAFMFYRTDNYFFDNPYYRQSEKEARYLKEAFAIYDTLLNLKSVKFSAKINYELGNLSLYANRDFDLALEFYHKTMSQTDKPDLEIKCIQQIILTNLAKGEMEQSRKKLRNYMDKYGEKSRKKLLSTKLLLDFYSKNSKIDSLANNALSEMDFSQEYYNDILELLNFVRSNQKSKGWDRFLEGENLLRQDNLGRARSKYKYIVQNYPESKLSNEACFRAAQLNLYFDNSKEARKYISKIDSTNIFKPEAVYMFARIMDEKQNHKTAEKWYGKLLKEYPEYININTARKRLKKLRNTVR